MTRRLSTPPTGLAICYGGELISFQLQRAKTKRLTISVCPDLTVRVRAPQGKDLREIKARVERRATWISKQLHYFRSSPPVAPPRQYVSGETHMFLGRQYRLKIHLAGQGSVKLLGRHLHVWTPTPRLKRRVKALVDHWYRQHAKKLLDSRVEHCYQEVKRFGIPAPSLRVKKMHKRWGSCTRAAIILNPELIKVPLQCIDYVIVHELCHLRISGHNSRFFRLLTTCMPDWQHRKRRLDSISLDDHRHQ